jgi:hypothetical protein
MKSHQRRMVVTSPIAQRMTESDKVLIAAKALLILDGVDIFIPADGFTYRHILLDHNQILFANRTEAESLHLGRGGKQALTPKVRVEIAKIFPNVFNHSLGPETALLILRGNRGQNWCIVTSETAAPPPPARHPPRP